MHGFSLIYQTIKFKSSISFFKNVLFFKLLVKIVGFFHNRVPAGLVSGFGSGRVLPEVKILARVGSGNDSFGSGSRVFGYPLQPY